MPSQIGHLRGRIVGASPAYGIFSLVRLKKDQLLAKPHCVACLGVNAWYHLILKRRPHLDGASFVFDAIFMLPCLFTAFL